MKEVALGNAGETMLEDLEKFKRRPLPLAACLTDNTAPQMQRKPRPHKGKGTVPKWQVGLKEQFKLLGEDALYAVELDRILSAVDFSLDG